jgi:hypothetical protein
VDVGGASAAIEINYLKMGKKRKKKKNEKNV